MSSHVMSHRGRTRRWSAVLGVVLLTACTPASLDTVRPSRFVAGPTVSQEARQRYGPRADQAYEQICELLMTQGVDLAEEAADPVHALVDPLEPVMTVEALDYWSRTARRAVEGDPEAQEVVDLLRITRLPDPELVARGVVSQEILEGAVETADEPDRLVVDVEQEVVIAAARMHRAEEVTVRRSLSMTLVEDGADGWAVDEFDGDVDWDFDQG